jgi:hypothetical protein
MGYDTIFKGAFGIDKPLTRSQIYYLNRFSEMRHMRRDIDRLPSDPLREIVKLPLGYEGEHFVGSKYRGDTPAWTPHIDGLFNEEFRSKVLLLLYIQKCNMLDVNRDVFFIMIQYLSMDPRTLNYDLDENLAHFTDERLYYTTNDLSFPFIIDYNRPPITQPGLWCQWISNNDGTKIVWDEGEKFYCYHEWLQYIINHFMIPWGRKLTGEVTFQGGDEDDAGIIHVTNNILTVIASNEKRHNFHNIPQYHTKYLTLNIIPK